MATHPEVLKLVPHAGPETAQARTLLMAFRHMAVGGINDAHAASILFGLFGRSHRRPLVLLRALIVELARTAQQPIVIAPFCCRRMTEAEATVVNAIGSALLEPAETHHRLTSMLGSGSSLGALLTAQALAQAFEDLGRPLG